jgi:hypothetical protein
MPNWLLNTTAGSESPSGSYPIFCVTNTFNSPLNYQLDLNSTGTLTVSALPPKPPVPPEPVPVPPEPIPVFPPDLVTPQANLVTTREFLQAIADGKVQPFQDRKIQAFLIAVSSILPQTIPEEQSLFFSNDGNRELWGPSF